MKRIYLDYAATTPTRPEVVRAMAPYWTSNFGNAGALYEEGRQAKKSLDGARRTVAHILGAKPNEVYFTSGGTESDNLAILGAARRFRRDFPKKQGRIITTNIEHHAVLEACQALEKEGFEVVYLPVGDEGLVDVEQVAEAITDNTFLVTIMYANNEIGTIQPIGKIGKLLKKINNKRVVEKKGRILFHTDACQAAGFLNINVNDLGVDLMTLNSSKIYGPKGVGVLYARHDATPLPLFYGGGQEGGLRSGTEAIALAVGMAKALQLGQKEAAAETDRLGHLRDEFISQALKIEGVHLNGSRRHRLPNNVSLTIEEVEGESTVLYLDAAGVAAATGSACTATDLEPSHVILALGVSPDLAHGSLRFTMGHGTTLADVKIAVKALEETIIKLRKISAVGAR